MWRTSGDHLRWLRIHPDTTSTYIQRYVFSLAVAKSRVVIAIGCVDYYTVDDVYKLGFTAS